MLRAVLQVTHTLGICSNLSKSSRFYTTSSQPWTPAFVSSGPQRSQNGSRRLSNGNMLNRIPHRRPTTFPRTVSFVLCEPHTCLYTHLSSGLTLNQVKLQLAQEEDSRSRMAGSDESSDTTQSGFVLLGMEIEDAQYVSLIPLELD